MSIMLNVVWFAFIVSGLYFILMPAPNRHEHPPVIVLMYLIGLLTACAGIAIGAYQLSGG